MLQYLPGPAAAGVVAMLLLLSHLQERAFESQVVAAVSVGEELQETQAARHPAEVAGLQHMTQQLHNSVEALRLQGTAAETELCSEVMKVARFVSAASYDAPASTLFCAKPSEKQLVWICDYCSAIAATCCCK